MMQATGQMLPSDLEVVFVLPDLPVLRTQGWSIPLEELEPTDVEDILADAGDTAAQLHELLERAATTARSAAPWDDRVDEDVHLRDLLPIALRARRDVVVLSSLDVPALVDGGRLRARGWQLVVHESELLGPDTDPDGTLDAAAAAGLLERYVHPRVPRWTRSVPPHLYPASAAQVADIRLVVFAVPEARYGDLFATIDAFGRSGIPVLPVTFSSAGATVGPLVVGGDPSGLIQSRFGDWARSLQGDALARLGLFSTGSTTALESDGWRTIRAEVERQTLAPRDADITRYLRVSTAGQRAHHEVTPPTARRPRLRGALWGLPNFLALQHLTGSDWDQVRRHLAEGALLSIADAFVPEFADVVHAALDRLTSWTVQETVSDSFYFHSHVVYDPARLGPTLSLLHRICDSEATTGWASELSGIPCTAATTAFPSWYMPGDQTTIHDDRVYSRVLAFIWHLTRDWQASWGGNFVWCTTGEVLPLAFNALHLMAVRHGQPHTVMPVVPTAQGKRLCWNGWWQAAEPVMAVGPEPGSRNIALGGGRITVRPLIR